MKWEATVGKMCFTLAIGEGNGRIGRTTMSTKPTNETANLAPGAPVIPEELKEYAKVIRESIERGECDLFRNSSPEHAAVLMYLFCEAALVYAYIYCGHLNEKVYGQLWPVMKAALERGVDLRVIMEKEVARSADLARELAAKGALRTIAGQEHVPENLPHYAVFDGSMSRLETDKEKHTAIVRTNVAENDQVGRERLAQMSCVFRNLWEKAKPVKI